MPSDGHCALSLQIGEAAASRRNLLRSVRFSWECSPRPAELRGSISPQLEKFSFLIRGGERNHNPRVGGSSPSSATTPCRTRALADQQYQVSKNTLMHAVVTPRHRYGAGRSSAGDQSSEIPKMKLATDKSRNTCGSQGTRSLAAAAFDASISDVLGAPPATADQ